MLPMVGKLNVRQREFSKKIVADEIRLVSGDESLLRRAIRHLIDNGVRYTKAGGTVRVHVDMRADDVVLSVSDNGVGISRADQDRLYERFYRVSGQQDGEYVGSGLGLTFVKSISDRHGGRVWLKSQLGQGSTFYFSLPASGGEGDQS